MSSTATNEAHTRAPEARVWALVAVMAAAAAAMVAHLAELPDLGTGVDIPWPVVLALFVLADVFVVHLPYGRNNYSFSLSEIPLFIAVIAFAPAAAIGLRAAGSLIGLPVARVRGVRFAFNLVAALLETAVVIEVHRAFLDGASPLGLRGLLAAAGAGLAMTALASTTVNVAISLQEQRNLLGRIPETIAATSANVLANSGVAIVAIVVVAHDPWIALAVVPMAVALIVMYRAWTRLHRRLTHLQSTHEFIGALGSARDAPTTLTTVLREIGSLLRARNVEIVLTEDGEVITARLEDDQLVTSLGKPYWYGAVDAERALLIVGPQAAAARRRARLGQRDAIIAGLPPAPHGAISAILVADRLDEVSTFDYEDVQLLELLAGHASTRIQAEGLIAAVRAEGAEKEYQALHDYLTGLPNRRNFMECTVDALYHQETVAVLMIDLDRFKVVNDTLGHSAGDRVLIAAASRLVGRLAVGVEALIARLGGDEFAVLLPGLDTLRAAEVASDLHAALTVPLDLDGLAIEVGASIGVAVSPVHGKTAELLLQRADVAMYVAKQSQQGVEVYSPDRDDNDVRGLALVTELRHDLEADTIGVHYQPLVDLRSGRVRGAEALVRWTSPSYGQVVPDEFIPMAETTGLINLLTRRVLARSLAQCAAWRDQGFDLGISVNLSPRNLLHGDLVGLVTQCLEDAGLPARSLTLELTESSLVGDVVPTAEVLQRLRDLGVRIAIDDFGTGYSSLSYLSKLPVDEVKIDRSFVQSMNTDGPAIVQAATHLAHELDLHVVAEGVEDVDTWHALAALDCDTAQGFLLARPQSGPDLTAWLRRHSTDGAPPQVNVGATEAAHGPAGEPEVIAPVRHLRPASGTG